MCLNEMLTASNEHAVDFTWIKTEIRTAAEFTYQKGDFVKYVAEFTFLGFNSLIRNRKFGDKCFS